MLNIGPQELLLVLIIALIVVGPQRLPDLSRQIGKGLREFRKVQDDVKGMARFDLGEQEPKGTRGRSAPTAGSAVHRTPRAAPPATSAPGPPTPGGEAATQDGATPATPPETSG